MERTSFFYTNMDVILFRTFSYMIIMMRKVDPHSERGVGMLRKVISLRHRYFQYRTIKKHCRKDSRTCNRDMQSMNSGGGEHEYWF
jgi:hypothetical protein